MFAASKHVEKLLYMFPITLLQGIYTLTINMYEYALYIQLNQLCSLLMDREPLDKEVSIL